MRDLENGLSEHLARVRRGERLTVTLRGRPIAEIAPAGDDAKLSAEDRLVRMAEAGDVTLPRRTSPAARDFAPVRLKRGAARGRTASSIVLADRD